MARIGYDRRSTKRDPSMIRLAETQIWIKSRTRSCRAWFKSHKPILAFLGLALALGTTVYRSEDLRNDSRVGFINSGTAGVIVGCNRDFDTLTKVRGLFVRLDDANLQSYRSGKTTAEARREAKVYYQGELKNFELPDCRKAKITDTDLVKIPEAYYPGSPHAPQATPAKPKATATP